MIYIIWAPPRQGKTFFATFKALQELKKKNSKKKVFSNYPIIYIEPLTGSQKLYNWANRQLAIITKGRFGKSQIEEKIYSTYRWVPELIYSGIHDSMIIIDEAYRDYSSRNFKEFKVDTHTFFATNGHDKNEIYLIGQHPNRLDVIIREMVNIFYYVRKKTLPFSEKPYLFVVEGYLTEEDFLRRASDESACWSKQFISLRNDVKTAYDTHFFRHEGEQTTYEKWSDIYDKTNRQQFASSKTGYNKIPIREKKDIQNYIK